MIVTAGFVLGLGLLTVGRLRSRKRPLAEAVADSPIGELEPGRFRITGRVVPLETTPSLVDGAPCVYVERAEYRTLGTTAVPLLREVAHGATCHPFYLEDESGRLLVDPATTVIDCATARADGGLTVERRLRAGEEVSLVASFRRAEGDREEGEGPYRNAGRRWEPVADDAGPPRLSHRTVDAPIVRPLDGATAFFSGAGAMMMVMASLLAFVLTFMTR
jgi:hypothetical protein